MKQHHVQRRQQRYAEAPAGRQRASLSLPTRVGAGLNSGPSLARARKRVLIAHYGSPMMAGEQQDGEPAHWPNQQQPCGCY
jgi:hypothetical protein